ncbi:MAG: hypothetical protein NVS3B18_00200 [Candidatus Dormibacteria bacterium]
MTNLALTGMMGTGKSTVGPLVAQRLGMGFADSDVEVERHAGTSVAGLVATGGETALREVERKVVAALLEADGLVLALGGGALLDEATRERTEARASVITLTCSVPELMSRLRGTGRPLLDTGDRGAAVESLLTVRAPLYARYPGVDTTGRSPEAVAVHVAALYRGTAPAAVPRGRTAAGDTRLAFGPAAASLVAAAAAAGAGAPTAAVLIADAGLPDAVVAPRRDALRGAATAVFEAPVSGGEAAKRLDTAAALYRRLLAGGIDRGAVVVAVGGGVVTDLAGFVASTYLRGLPLVLIPTTLLGQVDAAVGGKTAVDLEEAKNAVGTFHPADSVLVDPTLLATLPVREVRNGLAEMVKTGIILDAGLLAELERLPDALAIVRRPDLVERTVRDKLAVVRRDPEDRGERLLLNFGHTAGHALEARSGYTLAHGAAVAQGMVVATHLAVALELCPPELLGRLVTLLDRLGLPSALTDPDVDALVATMAHDKKRIGARQRFVLPTGPGAGVVRAVPIDTVRAALHACAGAPR